MEAKLIAKKLELSDRIEHLRRNPAFITLKDHQNNFNSKLPWRLINPSKTELGKVSKQKLGKINKILLQHPNVNQWKNSTSVIKWFSELEDKNDCIFIKFDIREFYPSITEDILKTSLPFAKEYQDIPEEDIRIINHCRKSLLLNDNQPWKKKNAEGCFDVTMGSYDGTEICELVEIYILSRLSTIIDKNDCGLYRDDGLLVLRNVNGQQINRVRKNTIQTFKDVVFS